MVSTFLFLTFGMRILFFTDLVLEMFLVHLSSYKTFWFFLVFSSFFLMHFLIFLLISRIRPFHASPSSSFPVWGPESLCLYHPSPVLPMLQMLPATSAMLFVMVCPSAAAVSAAAATIATAWAAAAAVASDSAAFFRGLLCLLRFCIFDFLLEVSVHQLKSIFACFSFNFDWGRLVATSCLFVFGGFRTSPWHICLWSRRILLTQQMGIHYCTYHVFGSQNCLQTA